ncbi:calmodulin [Anaeramoeba ignava]|uniref:Calmodulin n=1 Tax=Anaeramoeba ignava TaxID=1746090 RepID=A0A9Q0R493_ANAIG|nr:calmodulin [Anaeramoeba ignava]|eukprot:Anaeramoba_ignava/a624251_6.p1 GENE.a624251_6~~a624251_6.p1  ORF type:complete len:162 (-),score=57.20 a624251_6:256-681(-)
MAITEKQIKAAFDAIDTDKSGKLDKKEFTTFCKRFGNRFSDWEINLMIKIADKDGDGISYSEFKHYVLDDHSHPSKDDLKKIFKACDLDGNGTVSKGEIMQVSRFLRRPMTEQQVNQFMDKYDTDKSGSLKWKEFKKIWIK